MAINPIHVNSDNNEINSLGNKNDAILIPMGIYALKNNVTAIICCYENILLHVWDITYMKTLYYIHAETQMALIQGFQC